LVLWAGAALCFIAYALDSAELSNLYLGVVLLLINIGTGFINFYQNMKSETLMGSFKDFTPP
jgi:sodium/potassium-transporting ATPase subunit alpha